MMWISGVDNIYARVDTLNIENSSRRTTMKVRISITVEVNVKEWNAEYASNETAAEVREAVQSMARDAVVAAVTHLPVEVK
jgi:hypothetical protein